ncbi:hypothetical protein AA103196_2301 [Ameyamaea chiangmaiensis NBRC 103196]|uniref:DUF2303 family protein n=1 Tax=Ameyamaea chiangmaiensis TaxID=442969 RepID=A0A850P4Z9_9PROT|nr:DUF2303 family protein [Ameyamaea chiangmaiensis]MBS4075439.1 DUF2303 family protein [Ameyamaea chiangmaiensis]NVN39028.1 DUF2303 family protein [Ameyamaea chiangmaiensis]GBQ69755.1 hypothetical protein AA103196_2301 [Ameyamaea chiangmaiensis NBRC 103196]
MTGHSSDNAALIDVVERLHTPQEFDVISPDETIRAPYVAVPKGMELQSVRSFLEEYRVRPERRRGTAKFTDLMSFLQHANRFKADHSALFASDDPKTPSLTSVLDYHEPGSDERDGTHYGQHRGHYTFPLSDTWKAWQAVEDGKPLSMLDFAEFLEDRIGDVIEPLGAPYEGEPESDTRLREQIQRLGGTLASPSVLLDLSRNFRVNEDSKTKVVQNLSSGEVVLKFETAHVDEQGAPVKVPNMFLIQTPVFHGGAIYRVPVRLRYRSMGGSVHWIVMRLRPEIVFEHALNEALALAETETGLPVFRGAPEV